MSACSVSLGNTMVTGDSEVSRQICLSVIYLPAHLCVFFHVSHSNVCLMPNLLEMPLILKTINLHAKQPAATVAGHTGLSR